MVAKVNQDLERFHEWLGINKLKMNMKKRKFMVISHVPVYSVEPIVINGQEIERVSEYEYLGRLIDERASFNRNCDYVCQKMAKKINFLGRISRQLDRPT